MLFSGNLKYFKTHPKGTTKQSHFVVAQFVRECNDFIDAPKSGIAL